MSRLFYTPGDWLGTRLSARVRRAIAAWALILIIITIPLRYPYRDAVSLVWLMMEVALVLSCGAIVSAETPVEKEHQDER
jgi:hypothetical protein